ncbi:MAG TPA: sensor histidine kinase KdpD [Ignavibacteriaceae bacterium]|nr:sensor histidine kinase KdpD [Ignavibacteriaceae bacterium]
MDNSELTRPDPEILLRNLLDKEDKSTKGKLKIFFGMCAGVGKTYSMLEAAHNAKAKGIDVVIGIVETHKRLETEELVEGLEIIPLKGIIYRDSPFKEMDIEAILKRKPSLVLVDELAHTNIPGSKYVKRFQDVLELLDNGIDVYTTLNVQHIESRLEIVKKITGTTIRETIPDSILERTNEIELIDITPEELLKRLSEGKVYTSESSRQAIENFFRKGNLTALREMALRITAEKVDKDLRDYKSDKNILDVWKSGQRLMCAVAASPYSAELIRWTRRLAYSLEAPWIAVYVETDQKISETNKKILLKNIKLVKDLGGEFVTTQDVDIISALIRVAKEYNISQIIIGKSRRQKILKLFSINDFTNKLIKESGDIDVYVVGGDPLEKKNIFEYFKARTHSSFNKYFYSSLIVGILTLIVFIFKKEIDYKVVSMLYLLLITLLPIFKLGVGPVLFAALLSALGWNFFFIPPYYTFHIEATNDIFMFILFFIVASVSGYLSTKVRTQQALLRVKENRVSILYNLSRRLNGALNINDISEIMVDELNKTFSAGIVILFAESEKKLKSKTHPASTFEVNDYEWLYAQMAFSLKQTTGRFTDTLPNALATYYPIKTKSGVLGVIGLRLNEDQALAFDKQDLLIDIIEQFSKTLEREYLDVLAKQSLIATESEKLYKTLFNSISHELKTPITTIIGAISFFNDSRMIENKEALSKIIKEIDIAAERLNRLVENLMDMARLESGNIGLKLSWNSITDLIRSALDNIQLENMNHTIVNKISEDVILKFDFALLKQAIINVLHNALVYTPDGCEITIEGIQQNFNYILTISDNGKGFKEEEASKLFDKFFRIPGTKPGGSGLGLSIAKGFIEAHGGTITAGNRKSGGAIFTILLPLKEKENL